MSQPLLTDPRQAAAKSCDEQVVQPAVVVYVWRTETRYDELLASGHGRRQALSQAEGESQERS